MSFYWVNVGISYKEVLEQGILWAPQPYHDEQGTLKKSAGWLEVPNIKRGDIIFCNRNQNIIYIAIATSDASPSPRPKSRKFDQWKNKGNLVEVDVIKLSKNIPASSFKHEFFEQFNSNCTPKLLNKNLDFCQQYAISLPSDAGKFLLSLPGMEQGRELTKPQATPDSSTTNDYPFLAGNSWECRSDDVAIKTVDKTLQLEASTGIPKEITGFFSEDKIPKGESKPITIHINGKLESGTLKHKPDGRHVLQLSTVKAALALKKLSVDEDTLWFEKIADEKGHFILSTMTSNEKLAVYPKPGPGYRNKPSKTTGTATTEVRYGQSYYRDQLSKVCGGKCVVTGVEDHEPKILIASHTKSWKESNDDEKLDGHNGLLLSPHIDKLFDRHLITFSKQGKILVSASLSDSVIESWGIDIKKTYYLTNRQQTYMEHHRQIFHKKQVKDTN
ncbi:HNH endonuclease [Shewanella colwelliana]|uniref:HNH endonuclease n=1 Tax=Shewanella colwelliana TaxID=23 RepID=UPI0037354354